MQAGIVKSTDANIAIYILPMCELVSSLLGHSDVEPNSLFALVSPVAMVPTAVPPASMPVPNPLGLLDATIRAASAVLTQQKTL